MNGNSCILVPSVKKDNKEHSSKLFLDLSSRINNRDLVVSIYSIAVSNKDLFDSSELDEYGEPVVESVLKKLNIGSTLKNELNGDTILESLGLIKNSKRTYYNTLGEFLSNVRDFNSDKKDKLIVARHDGNGYYGEVINADSNGLEEIEHQEYINRLNNKMNLVLNKLGFDIERVKSLEEKGVFTPENAEENANGLINIIKLSKGLSGDYAFSEEFSHFLISGLRKNELINRLLNTLNTDIIKSILGNEYELYVEKYKKSGRNDKEIELLLKEEVAGKLFAERLNNNIVTKEVNSSLWFRFEKYVKEHFKEKDENEILEIINEAKQQFDTFREQILNSDEPDFLEDFDKLEVSLSDNLFQIDKRYSESFEKLNNEILTINAKRKQLFSAKGNTSLTNTDSRLEEFFKIDEELRKTEEYIDKKKYELNCIKFLKQVKDEIESFFEEEKVIMKELNANQFNHNNFVRIGRLCGALNNIKDFLDIYLDVTSQLVNIRSTEPDLIEKDKISDLATITNQALLKMKNSYDGLRFDLMYYWLKTYYWENNIEMTDDNGEMFTLTLESMLRMAPKDINNVDLLISEMGHCSDPLLNLVSTIHKKTMAQRDIQLEEYKVKLAKIYTELGGGPTDFIYERVNGKLTGNIKSMYNFDLFNKDRQEYIETLKDLDEPERIRKIRVWDNDHTYKVIVDKNAFNGKGRTESFPNILKYEKYKINDWDKEMTDKQKIYFNEMLKIKAEMETFLGFQHYHLYLAPQITSGFFENLTSNKTAAEITSASISNLKKTFVKDSNDIEYGELTDEGKSVVITDMHKNPIKKVPVYFVNRLSNMDRLNTDFTKSMSAYCAMALNYKEMNKVINQLETLKDLILDREVKQYNGNNAIVNNIRTGRKIITEEYTKKGKDTNIGKRAIMYYDMNFYGMQKAEERSINMFGADVSLSKFADWIKSYSGVVNLGLNTFSGISNVSVGEVQMFIEAMANSGLRLVGGEKETFGLKDLIVAHWIVLKNIIPILSEYGNPLKKNYLSLLLQKYDAEQSFFDDMKQKGFYNNSVQRIIGNNSIGYLLQNIGEFWNHAVPTIAMLHAKEVLVDGQKTKLLYAYKEEDNRLVNKGEIKTLDNKVFTNNKFIDEKLRIQEVNHQLNGSVAAEDLGTLHNKALGRLGAQFRQWMPDHYGRRFGSQYLNTASKKQLDGYWDTAYKFVKNLAFGAKEDRFNIVKVWSDLSNYQKLNMIKGLSEISMMFALNLLIKGAFADDDNDDDTMSRGWQMVKYQMKRTYMEMAASMPIKPIALGENLLTMLQSPAAAIKSFNNLLNLFCFWNLGNEIQSGRYEGWSVYTRDLLNTIPLFANVRKVYDLAYEKYMFIIFPS